MIKKIKITNMNITANLSNFKSDDYHFKVINDILNQSTEFKKLGLSCTYTFSGSTNPMYSKLNFLYNFYPIKFSL